MSVKFLSADPALAEFFFEHRQDPVNRLYNPLLPSTVEMLRERLSRSSSDFSEFDTTDAFFWFIEFESKLAGIASLQNLNRMMLTAELGYGISAELRGRGLATEVVRELTKRAFANTPLRRIMALVHEENLASRRVLEKVGYRNEGTLREHFLIGGQPANEVVYGILRREVAL